jgi:hypothetical protein
MNEEAICVECGAKVCGHTYCPQCKSVVYDEYAEEQFAINQGYQELGGES